MKLGDVVTLKDVDGFHATMRGWEWDRCVLDGEYIITRVAYYGATTLVDQSYYELMDAYGSKFIVNYYLMKSN